MPSSEYLRGQTSGCGYDHDPHDVSLQFRRGSSGVPMGGGAGGHGPRAQALEGAPGQLVGANFKKKIRPRQISKVT